jgi:hypothetical protein
MYERTRFGTTPHPQKVVQDSDAYEDRPWMAREKAGRRSGLCGSSRGRIWSRQQWPLLALSTFSQKKSKLRAPSLRCTRRFCAMTTRDDDVRVRPGRINHGNRGAKRPQTFVGEVMRASKRAGHIGDSFRSSQGRSRSRFGRGRRAAVSIQLRSNSRRVVMKARVVRHQAAASALRPSPSTSTT